MIYNISHNTPEIFAKIDKEVGKRFGFFNLFKDGGIGSPKLFVNSSSSEIEELLALDSYTNSCNIELRPTGIIVRFKSKLETFALPIPFYKLTLYKGKADEYSVYRDQYFLKVKGIKPSVIKFIGRIQDAKAEYYSQFVLPY
ncbi:MAG: hypothetical protein ACJAYA_000652 [Bacteroidia bacterium]|jgi:hypothetical protein